MKIQDVKNLSVKVITSLYEKKRKTTQKTKYSKLKAGKYIITI